jgi:hypothetical protein
MGFWEPRNKQKPPEPWKQFGHFSDGIASLASYTAKYLKIYYLF